MALRIESVSLEKFRAFRKLEVQGLGRVNLITGRNNTGKSSFLEALRLLASNAAWGEIYSILTNREELLGENMPEEEAEGLFLTLSSFFCGFPEISQSPDPIVIATEGGTGPMKLTLSFDLVIEERGSDGGTRLVPSSEDFFGDREGDLALIVGVDGKRLIRKPRHLRYNFPTRRIPVHFIKEDPRIPCEFVGPYGGRETTLLAHLWDRVALTNEEKYVIKALHIIDSNISAVTMIEKGSRFRTAVVRSENISRPVSLRSFGDGLNRLFGIILSLVCAKNGLLLIDEFENGLHHTVQYQIWSTVFKLAQELDIQVFATSHSWDAIEAFQKAAADTPEVGALIRLSRKGEDILPTVFTEEDLAVVTRDRIEVR